MLSMAFGKRAGNCSYPELARADPSSRFGNRPTIARITMHSMAFEFLWSIHLDAYFLRVCILELVSRG
jgi:hypothetical protein